MNLPHDILERTETHLAARGERAADHQAENRALSRLASELATDPDNVLRVLCEEVLTVCRAESSGVSLTSGENGAGDFVWPAVAGKWLGYTGGGMPRNASPCGVVVERNVSLLFHDVATEFPDVAHAAPPIREILLTPFCIGGRPFGTVWAILHSEDREFDREDRRVLESIAQFAAAAYQIHREMARRAEGERRRDAVLVLGDQLRDNDDPEAVVQLAAHCLAVGLSADRAGFGTVDVERETIDVLGDWCAPGVASVKGRHALRSFGSIVDALKAGQTVALPDILEDGMTRDAAEAYAAISARSLLNLPIFEQGRLSSAVFATHAAPHAWTEDELRFVRQVGDRVHVALARLRADRQQQVVNQELSHRLKNTLAMVQAIAGQTLRQVTERDAVDALMQRISALSRAHEVLLHQNWLEAPMSDVAEAVLSTFENGDRFRVRGPTVILGPRATLSFSLLLHELGTNAVKYGALSVPDGRVEIDWRLEQGDEGTELDLTWRELGGPAPSEPSGRGFGSRLIRMGMAGTGGVELSYLPSGLTARMRASLSQLQQS